MIDNEVIQFLMGLGRQLQAATSELGDLLDDAAIKKHRAELSFARAFLSEDGAVDVRKQRAIVACEVDRFDSAIAEARVSAAVERVRTLRARIEVGRSLNAAVRADMAAAGLIRPGE